MLFCDHFVLGKHCRMSFACSTHMTSRVFHTDLCGSRSNPTFGNNKYFLSIIDNFSRRVWIYLMKDKYEIFMNFKNWKVKVENQIGKKATYLHTDNSFEFCNTIFDNM